MGIPVGSWLWGYYNFQVPGQMPITGNNVCGFGGVVPTTTSGAMTDMVSNVFDHDGDAVYDLTHEEMDFDGPANFYTAQRGE